MREKWSKDTEGRISDGHPIPQRFLIHPPDPPPTTPIFKSKLLLKSPSHRAMKNYHDLSISEDNNLALDNLSFIPESDDFTKYDEPYTISNNNHYYNNNNYEESEMDQTFDYEDFYDFTRHSNVGTISIGTTASCSELNSHYSEKDLGSTVKLVTPKVDVSTTTWFAYLSTVICTLSLAAGIGNIYRLPQAALLKGGLPFLVAYVILMVLVGLPLLFLELGIGQLAQEGFIKTWRAVPFFKGVGYVKLIAGCLLSVYYPLYMGLSLYYIIWLLKGPLPFQECSAGVKITQEGYSAAGKTGQECLRKTFLKSPFDDPSWLGIYAGILFVLWIIITTLSIRKTKSYIKSLSILFLPIIACYIALTTKAILAEEERSTLRRFVEDVDWNDLLSAKTWYFAAIQVFFSTNVGFGSFTTNAAIMYNKVNPLWTALGYIGINLVFGIGSVLMCHILTGNLNTTSSSTDVPELRLMALIYDISNNSASDSTKIWAVVTHLVIVLAGFVNMATLTYTLLKAITVQTGTRLKWWQTSIVLSFIGFVLGCALLLQANFDLVHLLDHYIVGNLILVSVVVEVFAFVGFYGTARIQSDFEFMLGHILSKVWIILWWIMPVLLTGVFVWGLATLPLEGIEQTDADWLYATGWSIVLVSIVFIFIMGVYTVVQQDGYTTKDKLKASLEPSNNWGPKDPIIRHTWLQWNTKAQRGERDFTLKRRGTRDYTRSVKRGLKKAGNSELSTSISGTYQPRKSNEPPVELENNKPLRITSLVDTLNPPYSFQKPRNSYPGNMNPLARGGSGYEEFPDSSNSEGYGTFRKGPYVIDNESMGHVCHRKYSDNDVATEF